MYVFFLSPSLFSSQHLYIFILSLAKLCHPSSVVFLHPPSKPQWNFTFKSPSYLLPWLSFSFSLPPSFPPLSTSLPFLSHSLPPNPLHSLPRFPLPPPFSPFHVLPPSLPPRDLLSSTFSRSCQMQVLGLDTTGRGGGGGPGEGGLGGTGYGVVGEDGEGGGRGTGEGALEELGLGV